MLLSEQVSDTKAFAFLNEVKEEILKKYPTEELMNINSFQFEEGKKILAKKMQFYNSNPLTTNRGEILENLNIAKDAVIENIETLIERNNKIDIMVQKSDNLKDFSNNISAITGDILKKESERKNRYVIVIISLFIIVLILIYIFATN
jgi:hypothetical protein